MLTLAGQLLWVTGTARLVVTYCGVSLSLCVTWLALMRVCASGSFAQVPRPQRPRPSGQPVGIGVGPGGSATCQLLAAASCDGYVGTFGDGGSLSNVLRNVVRCLQSLGEVDGAVSVLEGQKGPSGRTPVGDGWVALWGQKQGKWVESLCTPQCPHIPDKCRA